MFVFKSGDIFCLSKEILFVRDHEVKGGRIITLIPITNTFNTF